MDKKYQIFISSTFEDLKKERDSAIKTVLNMEHIPIGMEMFNAGDEEQWELIKRTIKTSDYYIVIIGFRYGTLASEGVSYTEKEYDYAVENNIPVIALIKDSSLPSTKEQRETKANMIKKHEAFLTKAKSKIAKFWKTEDEMSTQLATSLQSEIRRKPMIGWIRSDFDPITVNKEILALTKENRELRSEIIRYKDKEPSLGFNLISEDDFLFMYKEIEAPLVRKELSELDIPSYLGESVSLEEIHEYNENLPTEDDYKKYNVDNQEFLLVDNNKHSINLTIFNDGRSMARNVRLELSFPRELLVYDKHDVEDLRKPRQLKIPNNPIRVKSALERATSYINNPFAMAGMSDLYYAPTLNLNRINGMSTDYYVNEGKNKFVIRINELLHTTEYSSDVFYVIPTEVGEFVLKATLISEEMEIPKVLEFKVVVS